MAIDPKVLFDNSPLAMPGRRMTHPVCRFGSIEIDPVRRRVDVGGHDRVLGARAFDLLMLLIAHPDRVVSKQEILDVVWCGLVVEEANITVQVSTLRAALGKDAIATVPGIGYRWTLPADEPGARPAPAGAAAPAMHSLRGAGSAAGGLLLGRDADVVALCAALEEERLVTITGPAGVGKTSVARAAACAVEHRFARGAVWADVAALRAADQIPGMVAANVGIQLGPGDAIAALLRQLGDRDLLLVLVLDNCEHLADAVAQFVSRSLQAAPALRVLATSQVPLCAASESIYRLLPLEIPAADADVEAARRTPALSLLVRRARAADHRFELSDEMVPWASAICSRLDGIPLALELAAGRLPALGPRALHDMLDQRFALLNRNRVDLPARQLALQAALDWSCSLLAPPELQALQRLSSFVAGFGLEDAGVVLATAPPQTADLLGSLVDKSLVQVEARDPPRYRLLESTRMHAAQGLRDAGEGPRAQSRWRAAMVALARRSDADFWRLSDARWVGLYGDDQTGLEAALEDCVAAGDSQGAGLAGLALQRLDELRGIGTKLRARTQIALSLARQRDAVQASDAELWTLLSISAGPLPPSLTRAQASEQRLAAWRLRDDARELCTALGALALERAASGASAQALELLGQAEALVRPDWPQRLLTTVASQSALALMQLGDAAGYARAAERMASHAARAQSPLNAWRADLMRAHALLLAGHHGLAVPQLQRMAEEAREAGQPMGVAAALAFLTTAEVISGDMRAARSTACKALSLALQHDMAEILREQAVIIAALDGKLAIASKLLGFAHRPAERYAPVGWLGYSRVLAWARALLERALPAQTLVDLIAEGDRLEFDAGIELMQQALAETTPGR